MQDALSGRGEELCPTPHPSCPQPADLRGPEQPDNMPKVARVQGMSSRAFQGLWGKEELVLQDLCPLLGSVGIGSPCAGPGRLPWHPGEEKHGRVSRGDSQGRPGRGPSSAHWQGCKGGCSNVGIAEQAPAAAKKEGCLPARTAEGMSSRSLEMPCPAGTASSRAAPIPAAGVASAKPSPWAGQDQLHVAPMGKTPNSTELLGYPPLLPGGDCAPITLSFRPFCPLPCSVIRS